MSYCFDTLMRVYTEKIEPQLEAELAFRFRMVLEEMHEANHRLNDGINKDARVTRMTRALERHVCGEDGNK